MHVVGISKILCPYGLLFTASIDIQAEREKFTLNHIPLALIRSPALFYDLQQQPPEVQRLVQLWDPAYRLVLNKEVRAFLQKL